MKPDQVLARPDDDPKGRWSPAHIEIGGVRWQHHFGPYFEGHVSLARQTLLVSFSGGQSPYCRVLVSSGGQMLARGDTAEMTAGAARDAVEALIGALTPIAHNQVGPVSAKADGV
jgi:hypothetical protein